MDAQPYETPNAATLIPTDLTDLIELIHNRWDDLHERDQLRRGLITQLGDEDEAWRLYDRAVSEVLHYKNITRLRRELREALAAIELGLRRATNALNQLTGGEVYDVEYAESGTTADDMHAFLVDAGRMIRAAAALNPCPTEEETSG